MLKRSFFSDLYKYCSLPTFKVTFFLILGVSIFFTIQNIQVINALAEGNGQAVNLDPSMLSSNPVYTVRDALLSSPYQASVIFLPILVSLVYSTHYQFGDDFFSQLLIPNWKVRLTGFIASSIVLSLLSTLIFSIVNAVILFVFLDSTLKNFLELTLFLDVTVRVMIFAIVLTLLALLFVIVTKKSMTALIADVLLLVITLSGILRGISSNIENLLPLIGAKSFAFGRIEGTQMSQLYGFTLLVVEGVVFLVLIIVVEKIRMGRKNGKFI
ncbi:hypothetical protein PNU95_02630 [Streptococcus parasanguinis]|uniref:hypothetical protein n=1 Tax=Streptococcus TaxID=1301 RepID=UPI000EEF99CE|nr:MULTISPECIES: hypothetical protein [Streptococcus]MDB8621268.1 hypothetical protein [Streptococcus parasanguinis]MDB8627237.1 hypothetical protein [Streptococcus parasanguinis]RJU24896.1 hypothetical protein DW930_01420 [Streptococcus sp. AM43-2AT]